MPPEPRRPPPPPGPYIVLGLARSGVAAALALAARGERVIGVDAAGPDRLGEVARRLRAAGVEVHLDAADPSLLQGAGALVKSPGVPPQSPLVRAAREHGLPVLGELEFAWRLLANPFIAVTGTNGKTTTVEWIGHLHREAGVPVAVAGNVGTALSSLIDQVDEETTVVAECSSFQLEDTVAFAPEVAVLLNLVPDHLDRHHSFENYRAAKLNIFAHQGPADLAVLPEAMDLDTPAPQQRFSALEESMVGLAGRHNRENAAAAAAVAQARRLDPAAVARGLADFTGVAHRLERVAERGGVSFVNDSKATNVDSTLVALEATSAPIHLILGGDGKGQDFTPLAGPIAERCVAVYLIGAASETIADALVDSGVELVRAGDLGGAVARAVPQASTSATQLGHATVLLSPACASYDQFTSFEARGERFRELVTN